MGSFDCYCALCSGPLGIYCIKFGSEKERALARRRKRVENKRRRLLGEEVLHEDSKEWKDEEKREDEEARKASGEDVKMSDGGSGKSVGGGGVEGDKGEELDDDAGWDSNEESVATIESEVSEGENGSNNGEEQGLEDRSSARDSDSNNGDNDSEDNNFDDTASDHWSEATELSLPGDFDFSRGSRDETDRMYSYHEDNSYDPTKLTRKDVQWTDRCRVLGINKEVEDDKKAFISGRGRYSDLVSQSTLCKPFGHVVN